MATFLTRAWLRQEMAALRERINTWPMPWQVKSPNPLIYLKEDRNSDRVNVHRTSDNQLILSMTAEGDVYPFHMGLWEPEFANALGEALIMLARIYVERGVDRQGYADLRKLQQEAIDATNA